MSSEERVKLKALLNYWIEHNQEHAQEFREWAEKAKMFGEAAVSAEMLQAVQGMDKASQLLSQALKKLED